MTEIYRLKKSLALFAFFSLFLLLSAAAQAAATGNRYNLPRDYHSEISAASAYLEGVLHMKKEDEDDEDEEEGRHGNGHTPKTVILDVRTVEEYRAGHPRKAYNIPYPHIQSRPYRPDYIGQNPKDFFDAVAMTIPDRSTPILTLCRTGYRSVLAANILANPSAWIPEYAGMDIEGYGNVRNIWEGFVGNPKTYTDPVSGDVYPLDLNNDGQITNADRDGWMYYQGLPYSTKLRIRLLYAPYLDLYFK